MLLRSCCCCWSWCFHIVRVSSVVASLLFLALMLLLAFDVPESCCCWNKLWSWCFYVVGVPSVVAPMLFSAFLLYWLFWCCWDPAVNIPIVILLMTPVTNLPPSSLLLVAICYWCRWRSMKISVKMLPSWCQRHLWWTLTCKYLREFSPKNWNYPNLIIINIFYSILF